LIKWKRIGKLEETAMGIMVDHIVELGWNAGKDYLTDKRKEREARERIRVYIERQSMINEISSLAEEIDFEGLTRYMSSDLLQDVQTFLFWSGLDREKVKKTIFSKACSYAKADSAVQRERVEKLVNGILEILHGFYREQLNTRELFMIAEMAGTMKSGLQAQTEEILNGVDDIVNTTYHKIQETADLMRENREKISPKAANNAMFQRLHEFIMKKYIKARYRTKELSERDIKLYSDLFKLSIDIFIDHNKVELNKNIFDFVREDILTQKKGNLIKIVGPDGTGKSTFLSILYIYLYNYCLNHGFSFYPFYINLHFYDAVICDAVPNEQVVKEKMYKDLEELKNLVQAYPDISYIIIIDGNEDYFRTTLKSARLFDEFIKGVSAHKKIVCIGEKTDVHAYRKKGIYPYMYSRMLYTFRFKSISNDETDKWMKFIHAFTAIEGNSDLLKPINEYLKKFDLDEVDFNILSVFKDCYDSDVLQDLNSVSDLYKNYCMAYLQDTDDFEDSARMSYEYFMTNKKFTQAEIAHKNREWNLIHQHKTISNFLIAYYFIGKVKGFSGKKDTDDLEYLFPKDVNIFIKSLINEDLETQRIIIDKCKQIYKEGEILAKSQALYMLGRITHKSLRADILFTLEKYYDDLYGQLLRKEKIWTEQKERDIHLLLRSVVISLVYLGKKDKRDAYLKMLLNYPIANQINRGFYLEYYGDIPRKPDNRMYNYSDDGTGKMNITYGILLKRVKHYLNSHKGTEDLNFQINLFTLCSLIQVRLGKENLSKERMQNLKEIIDSTLQKKQGDLNIDFKAYLIMMKEDIENKTYVPHFLYEKLYGIKDIVRKGWEEEIKNKKVRKPYENVAEHIYYTWLLGMIYLPEEPPEERIYESYDKRKILDTVLIHDLAEIDVGDAVPREVTERRKELEDLRMRVLLMHDTYDQVSSMLKYKKAWNAYGKDSPDINGKIAYELDKIQAVYQFYVYKAMNAEFTEEKTLDWKNEKDKITTSLGKKILEEVVLNKFENN